MGRRGQRPFEPDAIAARVVLQPSALTGPGNVGDAGREEFAEIKG